MGFGGMLGGKLPSSLVHRELRPSAWSVREVVERARIRPPALYHMAVDNEVRIASVPGGRNSPPPTDN